MLKIGNIYHATVLKNGDIALATLKRGVLIISEVGKLKYIFDKQSGLINNATYFVSNDAHNDLWIAQEKGISHLELSVPFNRFGVNSGIDGNIQKLTIYNNNLYCGTSSGIYYMPIDKEEPWNHKTFQQLSPELIYNLDYCQIQFPNSKQNILLASFLRDLAVVYPDNRIESIHSIYGCYSISTSVKRPGRIFLGGANGLEVLDLSFENGKVKVEKSTQLTKMSESIRKIIAVPNGDLWIQSAFNSLFRISFDEQESLSNYQVYKYPQLSNTYPGIILTGMHHFNGKIFLTSNFGIFSADIALLSSGKQAFEPDLTMGLNFQKDHIAVQSMEKDAYGNYWFASSIGLLKYDISKDEIVLAEYKRLQGRAIQGIHISNHLGVSVISEEDIFILNQNYQKTPEYNFKVFFDEVEFGMDYLQQSFDGVFSSNFNLKQSIPHDQNTFSIKFSAAFFQKSESITYRYILDGFEKQWSEANKRQTVNYTNLPSGKYVFKVRAENIYNKKSNQAEFSFVIIPPWYQKPVALIAFFVFVFGLVWLFVFLYTLRLKKEKKKLQSIIKEAIHKEESQKEEIEKQAGKLYLANLELQKLSLVASKTDNAVSIMDYNGKIEWVNEGYTRLFGFTFGEVIHSKTDLLGEFADVTINDMVNLWFGDRKPIIFENQKATKYGTKVWVQTTLTPVLNENKQVKNLISIETDISRLKYAESEIASQKDEIARQRDIALQQRDAITSQQKEIIDSILYAERIQKAVFNKESDLTAIFKDSFIYDKPRDIVSGDFFWVHEVDNLKILAVVDSTGHGIPGAFMSLIGFTFLNHIIKENGILEPYQILNLLREKVIASLGQKGDDNEAKDGMDVSICVIDTQKKQITYAGANNKSYLVNSEGLIELEADKMPISIYITAKQSFKQKMISYQSNDVLYMFTDGYPDQFGGQHGKKFKSSRFKKLLQTISKENYNNQKTMLDIEFLRWKGALNQVDDILIVGVNLE
jgi:PAS domain S-box-containing protein